MTYKVDDRPTRTIITHNFLSGKDVADRDVRELFHPRVVKTHTDSSESEIATIPRSTWVTPKLLTIERPEITITPVATAVGRIPEKMIPAAGTLTGSKISATSTMICVSRFMALPRRPAAQPRAALNDLVI